MKTDKRASFFSLRTKILIPLILMLAIIGCSIYALVRRETTSFSERDQRALFEVRLQNIAFALEQDERRLRQTGLIEAYQHSFQEMALIKLKEIHRNRQILPLILDREGNEILWNEEISLDPAVKETILAESEALFEFDSPAGTDLWIIGKNFSPWEWKLLYAVPNDLKEANARTISRHLVTIIVAVLTLASALIFGIIARLTHPISALTDAADSISAGNWNSPLPPAGRDEVGRLSHSFLLMRNAIREQLNAKEREIQERKRAEEALRDKEENLHITLDAIGDAVVTTNAAGLITRLNPAASRLSGWTKGEAQGQPLTTVMRLYIGGDENNTFDPSRKILTNKEAITLPQDTVLVAKTGERFRVADSGAPIRNAAGDIVGVVIVFRDMTREYALQEQLQHSRKMDAIGQLAGGIAHDFNNMLGAIQGAADLLALSITDPENQEMVDLIRTTTSRAGQLTDKLLTFSRKNKIECVPLDVHDVIQGTVSMLERSIDKRITLDVEFNAEECTIHGDASQIQNALLNLGINGSHAMPAGGTLSFRTDTVLLDQDYCESSPFDIKAGRYLALSVEDTGAGIPVENLKLIFDPFFTTKEQGKGTGMGLSTVYGAIQQHKGAVTVYSEVNKGSRFTLYFPLKTAGTSFPKVELDAAIPGHGCILVIDDEEVIRITAEKMLQRLGYNVLTAENGADGVALYSQHKDHINMVLLDMIMPVMDGKEAFRKMKEINPDVCVVLASGFAKNDDRKTMTAQGLRGFIKKPYSFAELSKMIADILAGDK